MAIKSVYLSLCNPQKALASIEAFIIYDDLPTPGMDDYLIGSDYPIEPYL